MSDLLSSLRRLNFPDSCKAALDHLAFSFAKGDAGIPGLGSNDEVAEQIANEFIFSESYGRSAQYKKHSALHQLQILELILGFHQREDVEERVRHSVFRSLFPGSLPPPRTDFLAKLVSLAIGIRNKSLLDCAAVWMQRNGGSTDAVSHIITTVVNDYCHLVPHAASSLVILPQLSLHFSCNFITALTALYAPPGSGRGRPPLPQDLLGIITKWLEDDPRLCLVSLCHAQNTFIQPQRSSLWTSPTKPNTQTPIPGLVRWSTQAPLSHRLNTLRQKTSNNNGHYNNTHNKLPDTITATEKKTWSRLHLGLLQTFLAFPTVPGANQLELLTLADMCRVVKDVAGSISEIRRREQTVEGGGHSNGSDKTSPETDKTSPESDKTSPESDKTSPETDTDTITEAAANRLLQILQVALTTGSFRCSLGDLQNICDSIPSNKLLTILENQHLARKPPPMHHEAR